MTTKTSVRHIWMTVLIGVALVWMALAPGVASAQGSGWRGEYYNNKFLQGNPVLVRTDPEINFSWGHLSPDQRIPVDDFSVRWARNVEFESGFYRFTVQTDDGIRLYIDGDLVLDKWHDQGVTTYTVDRPMTEGRHAFLIDYYESSGGATIRLFWNKTAAVPSAGQGQSEQGWLGHYFNNVSLGGQPALIRIDPQINFQWGAFSPAPQIPVEQFSVRWVRELDFENGVYRFTLTTDDGMRLYVDGRKILDKWFDQGTTTYVVDQLMTGGRHNIMLEYYENSGGAFAMLQYGKVSAIPPAPANVWSGQYFSNRHLQGNPVLVRSDAEINFNWGDFSPAPQVPVNDFSVRWVRTFNLEGGIYRFNLSTDDGMRLYLDGQLILDKWFQQAVTHYSVERYIPAGNHTVMLEYFEQGGGATAALQLWKVATVISPDQLIK